MRSLTFILLIVFVIILSINSKKIDELNPSLRGKSLTNQLTHSLTHGAIRKEHKETIEGQSSTFNVALTGEIYEGGAPMTMSDVVANAVAKFFQGYLSSPELNMNPIACNYFLSTVSIFKVQCQFTDGDVSTLQGMQSALVNALPPLTGVFSSGGIFYQYSPKTSALPDGLYPCDDCVFANMKLKKD